MKIKVRLSITAATIVFAVAAGVPALALGQANPHANAQAAQAAGDAGKPSDPGGQATEPKTAAQTESANVKLRVCQNRQKAITNIMGRIADRGQKQLTLFSTIANRVETFYANKGKTLNNYDALVADVNAKQAAAQTTVDTIKSASTGFHCDGTNPQGFVGSFKDDLKSEITALQNYRTSVKNLAVGVKSAQGTKSSAANQSKGDNQ